MQVNNLLQSKKQNILKVVKKDQLKSKMKNMRSQLNKIHDNTLLFLIKKSQTELNNSIINQLIQYAHKDQQNAIIQLGNLIIDKKQIASIIKNQIIPKQNDYWCWLIKILAYTHQFNETIVNYLISKIIKNCSNFSLVNTLEALSQLTKNQLISGYFLNYREPLIAISKFIQSTKQEIYIPAFKIFSNLVAFNEQFTDNVFKILENKIQNIFKIGLLKSDFEIKLLTSQAMANCALNKSVGQSLLDLITLKAKKEKLIIMKQLSYYFLNLVMIIQLQKIQDLFKKYLIDVLNKYFEVENTQLTKNACDIIKTVFVRLRKINDQISFLAFSNFLKSYGLIQVYRNSKEIDSNISDIQFLLQITT